MSENQKLKEVEMLLAAYRPDGSDAADPDMAAALAKLDENPGLREVFEESQAFDAAIAEALAQIPVPADLRDEIAATSNPAASRRGRSPWPRRLLPLAAVLLVALGAAFFFTSAPNPNSGNADWAHGPLALLGSIADGSAEPDLAGAAASDTLGWLQDRFDASVSLPVSLASLPSRVCKFESGPDGKIALVCFDSGGGTTVHLLIQETGPGGPDAGPVTLPQSCCRSKVRTEGGWEYIAWGSAGRRYVLAANAESTSCCKRLRQLAGIGV